MVSVDSALNPQRTQVVEEWPFVHWSVQLCCLAQSVGFVRTIGEGAGEGCVRSLHVVEVHRFLRPREGGGGLSRRSRSRCQNGEGVGLGFLLGGRNPSSRYMALGHGLFPRATSSPRKIFDGVEAACCLEGV